jgi:hypothetical protein
MDGGGSGRPSDVTAITSSLGVPWSLGTGLIITAALDLATTIPLTPGNVGIASGAVALALQAKGVPLAPAVASGLAFHAVETAAGLALGIAGALALARFPSPTMPMGDWSGRRSVRGDRRRRTQRLGSPRSGLSRERRLRCARAFRRRSGALRQHGRMGRRITLAIVPLGTALGLAGCGNSSASKSTTAPAPSAPVTTAETPSATKSPVTTTTTTKPPPPAWDDVTRTRSVLRARSP